MRAHTDVADNQLELTWKHSMPVYINAKCSLRACIESPQGIVPPEALIIKIVCESQAHLRAVSDGVHLSVTHNRGSERTSCVCVAGGVFFNHSSSWLYY